MLEKLKINNFALIKSLEINFSGGFNVVLGETGAGKSIIFDALNFVLGEKAYRTLIRSGEETMKVSAIFSAPSSEIASFLSYNDLPNENEIFITRTYSTSGRGDVRINGELAPISVLKQLGELLIDSYGQNEGVALLKQKNHLQFLDFYKSDKNLFESTQEIIDEIVELTKEIEKLGGSEANRQRQIDMLKFQINEIESANLKDGEDYEINEKVVKLSNAERISEAISTSSKILDDENGALNLLRTAVSNLNMASKYENKLEDLALKIEESLVGLEDVQSLLLEIFEEYSVDEKTINKLVERKDLIDNLKRKYGSSIPSIFSFLESAKEELELLQNAEQILKETQGQKENLLNKAQIKLNQISTLRHESAKEFENKIEEGLREVGIKNAKFKVNFITLANSIYDVSSYSINCLEDVEFLFSANFGEELKPLSKTISGGELSRFMLVFKNIISTQNKNQTLILDEVDSGISGNIANEVAKKIAKLSKSCQILCITHLPQVASMGDFFFFVSKEEINGRTETKIKELSENQTLQEIAKLTYGNYDEKKIDLIRDLISENNKYKKAIE